MRVVVAIPAAGVLAGAAIGLLIPAVPIFLGGFALLAATLLAAAAWRTGRAHLLAAAVCAGFFAGGALLSAHAWREAWRPSLRDVFDELTSMEREEAASTGAVLPEEPGVRVMITGVLRRDASPRDDSVSLSVDVSTVDADRPTFGSRTSSLCARQVQGGVLVTVIGGLARARMGEWRAGRLIRAPAQLHRPARYLNPGGADEERALARRGTTLVGTVKSGALVEVLARGSPWAEAASSGRAFARRAITEAVGSWSPLAAAIVTAIVVGDRAGLTPDLQRTLQAAGTYHVIAISGGNIAILAALTLGAFRIAGLLGRGALLSAIAGLIAYGYFVGGGASVNRATLMAVVYFAARTIDLRGPPFNALALVAGLLVAADPLSIVDPAFLLTFGATLAILSVVPSVATSRRWPLGPLVQLFAASLAAEAVLFPVSAIVFSRITFAGLLLNFAAIPLMALAQIAGMLVVAAALVSSALASAIGWAAYVGAEGLVRSAGFVEVAPFLTWRVPPPHWPAVIVYYVSLVAVWGGASSLSRSSLLNQRRIPLVASSAVCALSAIWMLFTPWALVQANGDGRLHVTFMDVGQGDAALVRFPGGATLIVDTGGAAGGSTFDIGDRVVAPILREAGVRRLDTLALTHGDADHIGGAPSLIEEFRPREVWEGIPVPPFAPLRRLRAAATDRGARWRNLQTADVTAIDGVEVIVRHPELPDWERQAVRNDDSIVLELRWGEASIVLTGDIGQDVENSIAQAFAPARLRVVKVAHHGSLTSSAPEFLRALAPRAAVVSVGRANTFGHPAPAVLARYRDAGAAIFRTDQDGAVMLTTDGRSMQMQAFSGRRFEVQ